MRSVEQATVIGCADVRSITALINSRALLHNGLLVEHGLVALGLAQVQKCKTLVLLRRAHLIGRQLTRLLSEIDSISDLALVFILVIF